jgi:signal transduction histidine kinase
VLLFRQRLQQILLRDPGYISLSIRWMAWLIGLGTWLLSPPPESLAGAPLALAVSGGQLLLLSANPGWLRFEVGKNDRSQGALLRPLADLAIALGVLYLTGGWSSPLYTFAVTVVLAPSLRYGLLGALAMAGAFSTGFTLTVLCTPQGFAPAYLPDGSLGPDLISTFANPFLIGLFAAFLGEVLERLQVERARAEALAAAQERARLARDIHDGVAQTLFMLTMSLETGQVMAVKEGAEKTARYLDSLTPISRKALLELRNAMHNVEPLASGQSLSQALQQLLRDYQSAVGCRLQLVEEDDFQPPEEHGSALFRMLQEALTNACHHAQATTIEMRLQGHRASVVDDGVGFDQDQIRPGRGLDNLKTRAQAAGMLLSIEPGTDGRGTRVEIRW